MSTESAPYPVGTPGVPWGAAERAAWLARQEQQRSFEVDVLRPLDTLRGRFEVLPYGTLAYGEQTWPQLVALSRSWDAARPVVLVTGGVHGYETSGVHGALRFLQTVAADLEARVNLVVVPCVSPWAYETINRWNPEAVDPNRSFLPDSPAAEAGALMSWMARMGLDPLVHIDLHETTDTDNSEFRPAKAARDGTTLAAGPIPDGFYTVGHTARPELDFQEAVVAAVRQVTHIAVPDARGCIIGEPVQREGVILYDADVLGLCMGMTRARFVTTTEVYPDSPRTDPETCIAAQVAAVEGAVAFALGSA